MCIRDSRRSAKNSCRRARALRSTPPRPRRCSSSRRSGSLCAAAAPRKVSLTYDLSYNGVVAAELTEVLEHDGKSFSLTSEGRGKGIGALLYRGAAKRSCRGEITGAGLRPLEYRDQRGDKPAAVARFDWVRKTLTQEHDGKSETTSMMLP